MNMKIKKKVLCFVMSNKTPIDNSRNFSSKQCFWFLQTNFKKTRETFINVDGNENQLILLRNFNF